VVVEFQVNIIYFIKCINMIKEGEGLSLLNLACQYHLTTVKQHGFVPGFLFLAPVLASFTC